MFTNGFIWTHNAWILVCFEIYLSVIQNRTQCKFDRILILRYQAVKDGKDSRLIVVDYFLTSLFLCEHIAYQLYSLLLDSQHSCPMLLRRLFANGVLHVVEMNRYLAKLQHFPNLLVCELIWMKVTDLDHHR